MDDLKNVDPQTEQDMISYFEDLIDDLQSRGATNAIGTSCPSGPPGITGPPGAFAGSVIIGGGTITGNHSLYPPNNNLLVNNGIGIATWVDMNPEVKVKCKRCGFEASSRLGAFSSSCSEATSLFSACPECSVILLKRLGLSIMCINDGATAYEWALLRIMRRMGFDKMIKEFGLEDEIEFLLTSQLGDLANAASKYVADRNLVSKPE